MSKITQRIIYNSTRANKSSSILPTPIPNLSTINGRYYDEGKREIISEQEAMRFFYDRGIKRKIHRSGCLMKIIRITICYYIFAIGITIPFVISEEVNIKDIITITLLGSTASAFWFLYGYKLRYRQFIYVEYKDFETLKLPALQHEREKMRKESIIYMAISILPFLISAIINIIK